MTAGISVNNISVRFGATVALDGVSLDIPAGTCFGVLGESGSGKTTLMRVILGLQRADSGEVRIDGRSFGTDRTAMVGRAAIIQPIFQDPAASLSPRCRIGTLMEEVSVVLKEDRAQTRARLDAILERIGVSTQVVDKYPHQLSGGQARRVAIARALLMRPKILIADEPTAGLDVSVQGDLLNLFQDLREADDITIVIISHNLAVTRLITDGCIIMRHGKIVEGGATGDVFTSPKHDYTRALVESWPEAER